jgi:hypothetical protein
MLENFGKRRLIAKQRSLKRDFVKARRTQLSAIDPLGRSYFAARARLKSESALTYRLADLLPAAGDEAEAAGMAAGAPCQKVDLNRAVICRLGDVTSFRQDRNAIAFDGSDRIAP